MHKSLAFRYINGKSTVMVILAIIASKIVVFLFGGNFYYMNIKCEENQNKMVDGENDNLTFKLSEMENVAY